jgi:putative oxidoreductase
MKMNLDVGLLIFRVLFGGAIAAHGAQKLFGWFGGYGLKGTGGFFEKLGFKPGTAFAGVAGLSEFGGGLLLLLGLFTPLGAAVVLATMLVAAISVHIKGGFFAMTNGVEVPFLYAAAALGIAFTGSGTISLDALLGLAWLSQPAIVFCVLFVSILGAVVSLALKRPSHDPVVSHEPTSA